MPLDLGTVPAGSFVREKSRLRLYSARGARPPAPLLAVGDFRGAVFADDFDVGVLAALFFFAAGFDEAFFVAFFVDAFDFVAFCPDVFFAVFFLATGRFTVRLRVVAMAAPWCEECADGQR